MLVLCNIILIIRKINISWVAEHNPYINLEDGGAAVASLNISHFWVIEQKYFYGSVEWKDSK